MFEHLDVLFALLAGVVYTIIMIVLGHSLNEWALNLILIMLIMLGLGRIFKSYVKNKVLNNKKDDATVEEEEENFVEEIPEIESELDFDNSDITMFDEEDE